MLSIGDTFPDFDVTAAKSANPSDAFISVKKADLLGKWSVVFFWPKDFTFVCPTEIVAFGELYEEFDKADANLFGASTDNEFVHLAWRQSHKELTGSPFPWLSDIRRELATGLGILDRKEGVAQRATFINDPTGIIRFASITDMNVGRNPEEVLRVLHALQTGGELCPANWRKGQTTLKAA